jgi:hypothetical protein
LGFEAKAQHAVHDLLEGRARLSRFGPELSRYIVLEG